jgi:hypothetical protein
MEFGQSPLALLVDIWMNGDSGQDRRATSSRFNVPTAFISKSRNGMVAARSCEPLSEGMDNQVRANLLDERQHTIAVTDVERFMPVAGDFAAHPAGIALGTEEDCSMVSKSPAREENCYLGPDQAV